MNATKRALIGIVLSTAFFSCQKTSSADSMKKWKDEIVKAEKAFNDIAAKEGIPTAFLSFADDEAVLMRNNKVIVGKSGILEMYNKRESSNDKVSLTWSPDFVDVSSSGDMGYTYGKYTFTKIDSLGIETTSQGIFHTVWKRQEDGSWKYVWD